MGKFSEIDLMRQEEKENPGKREPKKFDTSGFKPKKDGRYIPGTNPRWDRELPDEHNNSLVDKNGYNWKNEHNFDEKR